MDRQRSMRTGPLLCDPAGDDGQRSDEQAAYPAPYRLAQAALPRSSRSPTSNAPPEQNWQFCISHRTPNLPAAMAPNRQGECG
jgi:hypothetical protein